MNKPLLSICIPTYERESDLRKCLISIFEMNEETLKKIEVCVSDNCSGYDLETFMSEFINQKNLIYKSNKTNVGFDKNVLELINMSSGLYVMLLGNDDVVIESSIVDLIETLMNLTPDAVFSNYQITLKNNKSYNAYKRSEFRSGLGFDWILSNLQIKCAFISSIVLKRNLLLSNQVNIEKFIGCDFIHMALAFEGLKDSRNIVYYPRPIVNAFDENIVKYNVKDVFLYKLGSIVNFYGKHFRNSSINSFKYTILKHVVFSKEELFFKDILFIRYIKIQSLFFLILSKGPLLDTAIATGKFLKYLVRGTWRNS